MNRRLFLFAVPAISFLRPKSIAQRLGEALKQYQDWMTLKYRVFPVRPPTKSEWDAMSQQERDAADLPSFEVWRAHAERWRAYMSRVHEDRRWFVKRSGL